MIIRPIELSNPLTNTVLALASSGNITDEANPTTVTLNGAIGASSFDGFTGHRKYGWGLFSQSYSNPMLSFGPAFSLIQDHTHFLTGTATLYLMVTSWDITTLDWNNQPAFPTDPDLIRTIRIQPGINSVQASGNVGVDGTLSDIVFDLRSKSPAVIVWGIAIVGLIDQGATGDVVSAASLQIVTDAVLQTAAQALQTVTVTNRASNGIATVTLTTAVPHNLAAGSQIQVSGVGADYDTLDSVFALYPRFVQCGSGTSGTTIKYTPTNTVPPAESVASGGTVSFLQTGL